MKQLKKKKGFTLVELIVVIAIIAILAAVAVPTTMHFVEKAHESNDQTAINISSNIGAIFQLAVSSTDKDVFNLLEASEDSDNVKDSFAAKLKADNGAAAGLKYISSIKFTLTASGNAITSIAVEIKGKNEAKSVQTVTSTITGEYSANQIFAGKTFADSKKESDLDKATVTLAYADGSCTGVTNTITLGVFSAK